MISGLFSKRSSFIPALLVCIWGSLISQQIDPFYTRLFNEGQAAFLGQNYKDAARALEIAIFGISTEKNSLGKAYVYLGLSYFYLNDKEKSQQTLLKASKLLGEDGFRSLGLQEATLVNLEKLLGQFNIRMTTVIGTADKSLFEPPLPINQFDIINEYLPRNLELERLLRNDPDNPSHYYALYALYVQKKDQKTAKRVLQELIKKKPEEVNAYYLLGKIEFYQKKYEPALGYFNAVLAPALWSRMDDETRVKSIVFMAVGLHSLGLNQNVPFYFEYLRRAAPEDLIQRMLKEESLESAWQTLREQVLKNGFMRLAQPEGFDVFERPALGLRDQLPSDEVSGRAKRGEKPKRPGGPQVFQ